MTEGPKPDPVGPQEPKKDHSRDMLVGYIRQILNIREGVRDLNAEKAEIKKEAKAAGFDPVKIEEVARWVEKVDKHGRDEMDEAEALYDLYRQVFDGQGKAIGEMMDSARDRALVNMFANDDQLNPKAPTRKQTAATNALAYSAISKMNRGIG